MKENAKMRNMKLVRVTRGITQLRVQMDTGIDQSTISKYETGDTLPTVENLLLLADYYKVSLDYLMDLTIKDNGTILSSRHS